MASPSHISRPQNPTLYIDSTTPILSDLSINLCPLKLSSPKMSSSKSSQSLPFRSKKPLKSTTPKSKSLGVDLDQLSAKTPEKPPELPRRARNGNVALSLKEVRKAAERLRDSTGNRTDQIGLARPKIGDCSDDEHSFVAKPKGRNVVGHKLPEKYEILCDFFNSLDNSIRLLRLKGSTPSFTNICPKIECFTDRRFTYSHLAQLKFLVPEVIEIRRTLVLNEQTSCMKPDLHITMNLDALDDGGKLISEGGNIYLRKVFRSRLVDFSKTHPEDDEVPEEALPEPFNIRNQGIHSDPNIVAPTSSPKAVSVTHSTDQETGNELLRSRMSHEVQNQQPALATHFPCSFERRFSQKPKRNGVESTCVKSPGFSDPPAATSIENASLDHVSGSVNLTPRKELSIHKSEEVTPRKDISVQITPAKLALTPARLMTATPGLCLPKRSYMTPENNSSSSPNKLVRRPPRTRSLKFDSPVKNNNVDNLEDLDINAASIDKDLLNVLPRNLLHSIQGKERIAMEERDPAISQAKRRRQMIACLPKIFNMIHFMFQSISRSVITKEELIHKIISSHSDIVDRREVEEQLNLLLELVPDWISEKLASGGDLLLRINKMTCPESIRTLLAEAE